MEMKMPEVSRDKILQELALIGFARVPDYLVIRDGNLTVRDLEGLNGAAIASVEKGTGGLKMKFYDKLKALELMGKYLGMFSAAESKEDTASCNLLECILDATRGEVDLHDIPEIQQAPDAGNELVEPAGASEL